MTEKNIGRQEQRLKESLFFLGQLGESVDSAEAAWLDGDIQSLERLVEQVDEAERQLAAGVNAAEVLDRLSDPDMLRLKEAWESRFTRLRDTVERQRASVGGEATDRLSRHRAADAYLKTQSR